MHQLLPNPNPNNVKCGCGRPLHYSSPQIEHIISKMVEELGPNVKVEVTGLGSWIVPRHFIALHGLKAQELPQLAKQFGFAEAKGPGFVKLLP